MNQLFTLCREVNLILGPIAFGALCYRVAIGLVERRFIYWPLLLVLTYYALIVLLTSPTGIALNAQATYIQVLAATAHVAAIVVCVFYPGPLKKEHHR